jgi:predicted RNA-binding Zn ribbon-like protein
MEELRSMSSPTLTKPLLGGRLALNFVNTATFSRELRWEELIAFLEASRIVSSERSARLLVLPQSDAKSADGLLQKSQRLRESLHRVFTAMVRKERIAREWIEPVNGVLRITEGHDELVQEDQSWRIEYIAREDGLDWLLAAIARSAAEIVVEGAKARIRLCANPRCGLFFYDASRTHRRRWCSMAACGNRNKVAAFARKHANSRHGQ